MLNQDTAKLTAKRVLERVRAAEKLAPHGTYEHGLYKSSALLSEWARIELILESVVVEKA